MSQPKVQLNVLLEPELAERLKERCKEEGKSRCFADLISVDPAGLRSDGTMPLAVVMKLARVAQGMA